MKATTRIGKLLVLLQFVLLSTLVRPCHSYRRISSLGGAILRRGPAIVSVAVNRGDPYSQWGGLLRVRAGASSDVGEDDDDDDGGVSNESSSSGTTTANDNNTYNDKTEKNAAHGKTTEEYEEDRGDHEEEEDEEPLDEDEEQGDDEEDDEDRDGDEEAENEFASAKVSVRKFDVPLFPSPVTSLYVTFGVMLIARRLDLSSPGVTKVTRALYILYLVGLQLFLLYVRIQVKRDNDRTPITVKNPLSTALQTQLDAVAGGAGSMMKALASSFLSSTTSVLEYDLKEANNMQRGLLFNMAFLWFLHFKMKQIQPVMVQTASGLMNLFYSPLFQVYVLKRNLERPFKTSTALSQMQERMQEHDDSSSVLNEVPSNDAGGKGSDASSVAAAGEDDGDDGTADDIGDDDEGDDESVVDDATAVEDEDD